MNLGMEYALDIEQNAPLDELVDGIWNADPTRDISHGLSYLDVSFPKPTWWTGIKFSPTSFEGLPSLKAVIKLEYKKTPAEDFQTLPSSTNVDEWTVIFDKKTKLPQEPRIEVTNIRVTLLDYPDYFQKLKVLVELFGCTLTGK